MGDKLRGCGISGARKKSAPWLPFFRIIRYDAWAGLEAATVPGARLRVPRQPEKVAKQNGVQALENKRCREINDFAPQ
jgi:hypothetical protein